MFPYWNPSSAILLSIIDYLVILIISVASFIVEKPVIPLWLMFTILWSITPAVAWILYFGSKNVSFAKANYPRYIWDVKTWCISGILLWLLVLVLSTRYFIQHGFMSKPSFSTPLGDKETADYRFLIFISVLASFIGFQYSIDAFWADAFDSYYLARFKNNFMPRMTMQLKEIPILMFP